MAKTKSTTQTSAVEFSVSPMSVSDATSLAEFALGGAVEFAAGKTNLDTQGVIDHLRWGNNVTFGYFQYGLGKQAAQRLGDLDKGIKAIYVWDENAESEDASFTQVTQPTPVHLVIWAEPKTSALDSVTAALDRALVESYTKLIGQCELEHLLDAQMIDDDDVKNHTGYGALLSSLHHRPIKVWER